MSPLTPEPGIAAGAVRVRVPATSANLGPGFDCLGLALGLHDEVRAEVTGDAGVRVEVDGEGSGVLPVGEGHLVVRAMRATFQRMGVRQPAGLALSCRNHVPHGRGLGSSAAAIVSGVLAARALLPDGLARLDDDGALTLAGEIEGHPDNVAACLLGGLTVAWTDASATRAARLEVAPGVVPVVLVPSESLSTDAARGLLPRSVPHGDAAASAGRAALLVAALTTRPDLLLAATVDRLHQDYRRPAMPRTMALVDRLRADGLPAVVSGAGPSVLVLGRDGDAGATAALAGPGWSLLTPGVDAAGATVERHFTGHVSPPDITTR